MAKSKTKPEKTKKAEGARAPQPNDPPQIRPDTSLTMRQLHDLYYVLVTDLNFDRSRGRFKESHAYRFHRAVGAVKDAAEADKAAARAALDGLICELLKVQSGTRALTDAQYGAFEALLITQTGFAHIGPYNKCDVGRGAGCDDVYPGRHNEPAMLGW